MSGSERWRSCQSIAASIAASVSSPAPRTTSHSTSLIQHTETPSTCGKMTTRRGVGMAATARALLSPLTDFYRAGLPLFTAVFDRERNRFAGMYTRQPRRMSSSGTRQGSWQGRRVCSPTWRGRTPTRRCKCRQPSATTALWMSTSMNTSTMTRTSTRRGLAPPPACRTTARAKVLPSRATRSATATTTRPYEGPEAR